MKRPRKPHAPKSKRRTRAGHLGYKVYAVECSECKNKAKLRMDRRPKFCIACGSANIKVAPSRFTPEEKERIDAEAAFFMARAVSGLLGALFGDSFRPFMGPFPPPFDAPPPRGPSMSRFEAASFIAAHANVALPVDDAFVTEQVEQSADVRDRAYKRAALNLHPDRGGSHDLFVKLAEAKAALDLQ